jgi:hypothetical protein
MRFYGFISTGAIPSFYRVSANYFRRSKLAETKFDDAMYDGGDVNTDDRRDDYGFPGAAFPRGSTWTSMGSE